MTFTMVIFLGVVMMTCLFGVVVIPRFDRPLAASSVRPVIAVIADRTVTP